MIVLKQTNVIAFHTALHSPKAIFLLDGKTEAKHIEVRIIRHCLEFPTLKKAIERERGIKLTREN